MASSNHNPHFDIGDSQIWQTKVVWALWAAREIKDCLPYASNNSSAEVHHDFIAM